MYNFVAAAAVAADVYSFQQQQERSKLYNLNYYFFSILCFGSI